MGDPATASAVTRYYGQVNMMTAEYYNNQYFLKDPTRGDGIITYDLNRSEYLTDKEFFLDNDNNWNEWNNGEKDNAALDAHYAAQKTYDYFKNMQNRDGWNDDDGEMNLYIHFGTGTSNAMYFGNGNMWFGDGNTATNTDPFTGLDCVAHEISHGISADEIDLDYEGESGALDEGLSDSWSNCVEEYTAIPGSLIWIQGEDFAFTANHRRNAQNPSLSHYHLMDGTQYPYPDTYEGTGWYEGAEDYGGVHFNSTVFSHWFYLLSQGGVGTNDNGHNYEVCGLGIDVASRILYRLETHYLVSDSDFADSRDFSEDAAEQLYGNNLEAMQVRNAWYAVGLYTSAPTQLTLSGDWLLCFSPKMYSLNNIPNGCSIHWTNSANISRTSADGNSYAYFKTVTSGPAWIQPILTSDDGTVVNGPKKEIWAGKFESTPVTGQAAVCPNSIYTYTAQVPGGHKSSYSYSWTYPSNWYYYSKSQNHITLQTPSSPYYGTVRVSITNACGTSGYSGITVYPGYGCGGYFSMYPNPASDVVTITINVPESIVTEGIDVSEKVVSKDITIDQIKYTIRIYDSFGKVVSSTIRTGTSFDIPLTQLHTGTYIVEVSDGKNSYRDQLIIK